MTDTNSDPKPTFEASFQRLQEIVTKIESGQLSLEQSLKLFEEGTQVSKHCQENLQAVIQKVEILMKSQSADGTLALKPFNNE